MEVVNLMFAILGHVLASFFYLARKLVYRSKKADVDTSSILERKEEIKQLWEKKMMATNDTSDHKNGLKSPSEAKAFPNHSEMNGNAGKMSNGSVHHSSTIEDVAQNSAEVLEKVIEKKDDTNNNKGQCLDINKTDEIKLSKIKEGVVKSDEVENNKIEPESIPTEISNKTEDTCTDDVVIAEIQMEKVEVESIHSTEFPEKLVEAENIEVINSENIEKEEISKTEKLPSSEEVKKEDATFEINDEVAKDTESATSQSVENAESGENLLEQLIQEKNEDLKESAVNTNEDQAAEPDQELNEDAEEKISSPKEVGVEFNDFEFENQIVIDTKFVEKEDILDDTNSLNSFHDDSLNESFPGQADENNSLADEPTTETLIAEDKDEKTFDDHFILDTREVISSLDGDEKTNEIAKKTRCVQKTEQPYSTSTTETKIAMEIREMREREEELKLMREKQIATSPTPKPQKQLTTPTKVPAPPKQPIINGYATFSATTKHSATPGYRASSVFGPRGSYNPPPPKDESKVNRNFSKETAVEKEIRLAKDREEELRKQKGLPPREDDSYVKPSQVKSSQAKVFSRMNNADNSRLLATAKIQTEIEEQTQREVALRDTGHIQTLSSERTDAKVTKLSTFDINAPECTSPTFQNGNSHLYSNVAYGNGHISPTDSSYTKRSTPSPTGSHSSYASRNNAPIQNKVSMQKFIASRGKETTFSAPKAPSGLFQAPKIPAVEAPELTRSIPEPGKLKRTISVESKIQQEIFEMKQREEELKHLHFGKETQAYNNGNHHMEYEHEQSNGQELCPRRTNLIAQWEQRIQKAEQRA